MEVHISMCHGMVALLLMMICLSRIEARMQATMQQLEVQDYLKRLNKPAIKSIKSPDGDIIDCVHIYHQPALDHPLLKNHTIQMRPAFHPIGVHDENKVASKKKTSSVAQLWHQNGTCPEETIPIRRIRKDDVLRAGSVERYGKKRYNTVPNPTCISSRDSYQQEHAYGYVSGGKYHGTNLFLDVWNPYVQVPQEFSSSQLWLIGNPSGDSDVIEAGWHVYPLLYGEDTRTRLFISWTSDNYTKTGCYNLLCSGFVQTSSKVALGATLAPLSGNDDSRYGFNLRIWKEQSTKNWWLKYLDEVVGYWPSSLFNDLSESASAVQWGGVVANSNPNGQHTITEMGSSRFAESKDASRCSSIQIVDESDNLQEPTGITTAAQAPNYYNVGNPEFNVDIGTYFFYGGPGN